MLKPKSEPKTGQTLNSRLNQKKPKADRHSFLLRSLSALFQPKELVVRELNDDAGAAKVTVLNAQFTLINRHQIAH